MKKRFLALSLMALAALPAAAVDWYMGFEGGYNYNDFSIDQNYAYDMRYKGAGGITVGIPIRMEAVNWFALQVDVEYTQKNHKMYRTQKYEELYTNTTNHYLQLPVLLNFSFGGEKIRGYIGVGGYVGCWLASHREGNTLAVSNVVTNKLGGNYYAFDEYRKLDNSHDQRCDAGLAANLGIRIKIDDRMVFHAETDFLYGLVSTEKTKGQVSPTPRYNSTYAVQIGLTFSLDKKTYAKYKSAKIEK